MRWVFDLDGVVWLAGRAIPGSAEAISRLRAAGHSVSFVTNNSTPTLADHVANLAKAGIEVDSSELATSSQAAASTLSPGDRVTCVGGPGLAEALHDRQLELVGADQSPSAVVVGRTLQLDFAELARAATAIRAGATFIATNTDATFPTPDGLEPGAGALVAYLEVGSGGKAAPSGKPAQPMVDLVLSRFGRPDVVVGDRPDTDGGFANRIGSPFALVLTGVTKRSDLPVEPDPDVVEDDLAGVVEHFLAE